MSDHFTTLHHPLAIAGREDGPLHRGELTLRHDREILERADRIAIRLDHPAMLDLREVRHIAAKCTRGVLRTRA